MEHYDPDWMPEPNSHWLCHLLLCVFRQLPALQVSLVGLRLNEVMRMYCAWHMGVSDQH